MVDSGTPVICLTRRWLRRSPRVKRRTSRIFRMTTRARGIDIAPLTWAGDVDGELAEPGYLAPGYVEASFQGCPDSSERVPGFNRNGCAVGPTGPSGRRPQQVGRAPMDDLCPRSRARRLPCTRAVPRATGIVREQRHRRRARGHYPADRRRTGWCTACDVGPAGLYLRLARRTRWSFRGRTIECSAEP